MRRRDLLLSMPLALPLLPAAFAATRSPGPRREWNVAELGAVGDGKTKNTAVLQKALDEAAGTGGGTVVVPAGTFVTGSLTVGSNTTLQLDAGAVLLGSPDLADYTGGKHLLSAEGAHGIELAGSGVIDGNALHFLQRATNREAFAPGSEWLDVVIFDWKPITQLNGMLHFLRCKDLKISGVTLRHSPRWTLTFDRCDTVLVDGMKIRNTNYVPESDGIDLVCSRNVIVQGCDIATADDAICLKSDGEGEVPPTSNILITNCLLTGCCNGFKIGTGSKGRFENIQFTNSVLYNNETALKERMIGAICVEVVDGGSLDGVRVSGIQIRGARTPLFVRLGQRSGGKGSLKNVTFENIYATGAVSASSITGVPGSFVENVSLENVQLHSEENGHEAWAGKPVEERVDHYPEALMFEHLPASALYVRHAKGIRLAEIDAVASRTEERPAMIFDDVEGLDLSALRLTVPNSAQPMVALHDCRSALLHGLQAPQGTKTFFDVSGEGTNDIRFISNDFSAAREGVRASANIRHKIVSQPQGR